MYNPKEVGKSIHERERDRNNNEGMCELCDLSDYYSCVEDCV